MLELSRPVSSVLPPKSTCWPVGGPGASASDPKVTEPGTLLALRSSVVLLDSTTEVLNAPATFVAKNWVLGPLAPI